MRSRAQIGSLLCALAELVGAAAGPGIVQETDHNLLAGRLHRLDRADEIRDVVERVVDPKDVDPALRGAPDEPANEVVVERLGADEKPASKRDRKRRLAASGQCANPRPRALDPTVDAGRKAPASGDLETAESQPGRECPPARADARRRYASSAAPGREAGWSCPRARSRTPLGQTREM